MDKMDQKVVVVNFNGLELQINRFHKFVGDIRKPVLFILTGLPQSGKSTWAERFLTPIPIVCRDSIRLALHGEEYIQEREDEVTVIENVMVESLRMSAGKYPSMICIDACHLKTKYFQKWVDYAEKHGYTILRIIFPVLPSICAKRAKKAGKDYLVDVINRMIDSCDDDDVKDFILNKKAIRI